MRRRMIAATAGALLAAGLVAGTAAADTRTGRGTPTCPVTGAPVGSQAGHGEGWRAGSGPQAGTTQGRGMAFGAGAGAGAGAGMGQGLGYGMGPGSGTSGAALARLSQGTLAAEQKQALAGMAEEEKLAHDVYMALAKTSGDARFIRIAAAETRHLGAVRALLTRYGVADPTAGKADGAYATAAAQRQYRDLVTRGSASVTAALAVGRDIEKTDIADLGKARTGVTAADVLAVYSHLATASGMHLRALGG